MTYIIRNTIVLGSVLLLIIAGGGYFTFFALPGELNKLEAEIKATSDMAAKGPQLLRRYDSLLTAFNEMNEGWLSRTKEIPAQDTSGATYEYIVTTVEKCGVITLQNIKYDGQKEFVYKILQPKDNAGDTTRRKAMDTVNQKYGYGEYTLNCVSNFSNLFKFIWYLENGRRLMKINELKMEGVEVLDSLGPKVDIKFTMKLHAYFAAVKELNTAAIPVAYEPPVLTANPFRPLISSLTKAIRPGEIDIRRSFLKGVIAGKAFIVDQDGKLRTLEEGNEVYLGYVSRISPEEGKIECELDDGGIQTTFSLYVSSSVQENQ